MWLKRLLYGLLFIRNVLSVGIIIVNQAKDQQADVDYRQVLKSGIIRFIGHTEHHNILSPWTSLSIIAHIKLWS